MFFCMMAAILQQLAQLENEDSQHIDFGLEFGLQALIPPVKHLQTLVLLVHLLKLMVLM